MAVEQVDAVQVDHEEVVPLRDQVTESLREVTGARPIDRPTDADQDDLTLDLIVDLHAWLDLRSSSESAATG